MLNKVSWCFEQKKVQCVYERDLLVVASLACLQSLNVVTFFVFTFRLEFIIYKKNTYLDCKCYFVC